MPAAALALEFPQSLAVYDKYEDAQKAVDYLSDHEFPVQNVMIVGTDLKQIERVTGRLTRGRVAVGGIMSGAWLGAFVALVFAIFDTANSTPATFFITVIAGMVFGLVWALIGYALTGGNRDFTSIQQVVATKYEVLVEHRDAAKARELIAQMDPMRAAQEQARIAIEKARAEEAARSAASVQGPTTN
jgi:hypothetical protein